jgi:hypothetical protein
MTTSRLADPGRKLATFYPFLSEIRLVRLDIAGSAGYKLHLLLIVRGKFPACG